jgi:hypothetical protein
MLTPPGYDHSLTNFKEWCNLIQHSDFGQTQRADRKVTNQQRGHEQAGFAILESLDLHQVCGFSAKKKAERRMKCAV